VGPTATHSLAHALAYTPIPESLCFVGSSLISRVEAGRFTLPEQAFTSALSHPIPSARLQCQAWAQSAEKG
jgi:hypothetical protein